MDLNYNINDIILIDDCEYSIINEYNNYYVLISLNKPVDIKVGKFNKNEFILETDLNIIKNVLINK